MKEHQCIIIVGAGFAGLQLAQDLDGSDYDVLLIDKNNYHQFQPLMYQVASARLEPGNISFPLRKVFQHSKNVRIRVAEVLETDVAGKRLKTSIGDFDYDYLVIAVGCTTNYFGNKELEKFTFPMKSVPEALQLRNRILQTFEDTLVADGKDLQALMNFVIVGGGPTGVELAGALAEMKKNVLPKDYPDKDFSMLTIFLLEGSPHTLNPMSEGAHKMSRRYLEDLGVVVRTETVVDSYDGRTVKLKGGDSIEALNVIWAAGVTGNVLAGLASDCFTRGNRLVVDRFSKVQNAEAIFAIGDIASMATTKYPHGHPQLAAVATSQGKHLAKNFRNKIADRKWSEYEYRDKGSMATVGKRKAVVDLPGFSFQGRLAWLTWMFVHLMLILSVRNKIATFISWAYSYFSNDSTLRILIRTPDKKVQNLPDQVTP